MRRERNALLFMGGLGVLLAFAIPFFLGRFLGRPIQQLAVEGRALMGALPSSTDTQGMDEIGVLRATIQQMGGYLANATQTAAAFSSGDLSRDVTLYGERDALGAAFVQMRSALQQLRGDLGAVVGAVSAGNLEVKADESRYQGAWRELAVEINTLTRAVESPITEASNTLKLVGQGELSARMTGRYQGVFSKMQRSMNQAVEALDLAMRRASDAEKEATAQALEAENARTRVRKQNDDLKRSAETILDVVSRAAAGDLTQEIRVDASGAISEMAAGLSLFLANLREDIGKLAAQSSTVSASSVQLAKVSGEMNRNASQMSQQAEEVAGVAADVSHSIQTTAAAVVQMEGSIGEISKNTAYAAMKSEEGVRIVGQTRNTMGKLAADTAQISDVTEMISAIAEQTNLLALNASIEAARAGSVGRGFNVVATEVKELARQTAGATEQISQQIKAVQKSATDAVSAMDRVVELIRELSDTQVAISSAVEEQSAVTGEIGGMIKDVSAGADRIAHSIHLVARNAHGTLEGAQSSQLTAAELSALAEELRVLTRKFKYERS